LLAPFKAPVTLNEREESMEKEERRTIGDIAKELATKEQETRDPIALEREAHKKYEENVIECFSVGKKLYNGDFYVTVLTKKEKLMDVMRHYYLHRESCPTPDYDQAVYRYNSEDDELSFLWVIPGKDTCQTFRDNAAIVDKNEWELLKFVLDFYDGTLDVMARKFNGESFEDIVIEA